MIKSGDEVIKQSNFFVILKIFFEWFRLVQVILFLNSNQNWGALLAEERFSLV